MRELRHRKFKVAYLISARARIRVQQSHPNKNAILILHVEQNNVTEVKNVLIRSPLDRTCIEGNGKGHFWG